MLDKNILKLLTFAETELDYLNIFHKWQAGLTKHKLIFAGYEENFFPGNKQLKDTDAFGMIKNLYGNKRIFFLDVNTANQLYSNKRVQFGVDPIIVLDTNAVSYLRRMLNNSIVNNTNSQFNQIIKYIVNNNFNYDAFFYYIENFNRLDDVVDDKLFNTSLELERLLTVDVNNFSKTGTMKSIFNEKELNVRANERISTFLYQKNEFLKISYSKYNHYCAPVLLKMIELQLSLSSQAIHKKTSLLLDFMYKEFNATFLAELIIALEFFKKGQKLKFFNKFQKGNTDIDILKEIKNMSMDFFYLRYLQFIHTAPSYGSTFCIPYALTFDKGLRELLSLLELKACIYSEESKITHPIYKNDILELLSNVLNNDQIEKYFSDAAAIARTTNHATPCSIMSVQRLTIQLAKKIKKLICCN